MNEEFGYVPIVELTRGNQVECMHYGACAVVDSSGKLLASFGDPNLVTYPRSSMKPFQVLPFVEKNGLEFFGLDQQELAIMCASHSGTDNHVAVLQRIHQKIGTSEADLQCGTHWPGDKPTADAMRLRGKQPTPFRHNCSGKHSGMLAAAKMHGYPIDDYLNISHPIQQKIIETVATMCELPVEDLGIGIDGCSAPVFAMPLQRFAHAVAKLCDPRDLGEERAKACGRITNAMVSFPEMVAGPGKFDTCLMQVMDGKAVVKGGAEGYQMVGLMPDSVFPGSPGIGIAMKFSDGDPLRRATEMLTIALLKKLGFSEQLADQRFKNFMDPILRNWRGLSIGEIRMVQDINVEVNLEKKNCD